MKRAGRLPRGQVGRRRLTVALLLGALVLLLVLAGVLIRASRPAAPGQSLRVDQFVGLVRAGQVRDAHVLERDRRIVGRFSAGTYWVAYGGGTDALVAPVFVALQAARVPIEVDQQWSKGVMAQVAAVLPVLVVLDVLALAFVLLRDGGGPTAFGRSRANLVERSASGFSSVAGLDETIEELRDVKDYLADPARFRHLGARVPRGILLYGPPGCGKTLLARALAGEAGVPFYSISGSDFVELFVGVGPSRIRDLFRQAERNAPAIVFIDEIDSLARVRQPVSVGGQEEREATLGQLLVEMDGFAESPGVVVLAATNRIDILDPALLRSGRFDRRLVVDRPDLNGRRAILEVHWRDRPVDSGLDMAAVARRTAGLSGADLANVVNEAALLAIRRDHTTVEMADVDDAVERAVTGGPERRSRLLGETERRIIAVHESGHAVAAAALVEADTPTKVSIISRGQALAFTFVEPSADRFLATRAQLWARLVTLVSGRAAERMVVGDISTGAQDDLVQATRLARTMVGSLGMSETLGPMVLDGDDSPTGLGARPHSEALGAQADGEIRRVLGEAENEARTLLNANRAVVEELAVRLLETETLSGEGLRSVLARVGNSHPSAGDQTPVSSPDTNNDDPVRATGQSATRGT
ncbi:MAG: ATP-dependent zinc metalloprotease FtsH [Acidimicrobiales bacterium]